MNRIKKLKHRVFIIVIAAIYLPIHHYNLARDSIFADYVILVVGCSSLMYFYGHALTTD